MYIGNATFLLPSKMENRKDIETNYVHKLLPPKRLPVHNQNLQ